MFDRRQTGYTLTESGVAIHKKAEQVEEAVSSVQREALGRISTLAERSNRHVRRASCKLDSPALIRVSSMPSSRCSGSCCAT